MESGSWIGDFDSSIMTINSQDLNLNSQEINISSQDFDGSCLIQTMFDAVERDQPTPENNSHILLENPVPSEFINLDPDSSAPMLPSHREMSITSYESESTSTNPNLEPQIGLYNFSAFFEESSGRSWVYSKSLNQVFIDMNKVLMMEFRMDYNSGYHEPLFIRAVAVYPNQDDRAEPVNRCIIHSQEKDPQSLAHKDGNCLCASKDWVGHVVRADCDSAVYCFNYHSRRHSVIIPVGLDGICKKIPFRFTCKTSCPTGMMRRPIRIIFTLETLSDFRVLGRQSILVKICSCPKRDRDRQEKDNKLYEAENNTDVKKNNPPPSKKKARLTHYPLPNKMARFTYDNNVQQSVISSSPLNLNLAQQAMKQLQEMENQVEDMRQQIDNLKQIINQAFTQPPPP